MLAAWRIDALFRRNDVQFNVTANLLKYNEPGKLFSKKRRHGHIPFFINVLNVFNMLNHLSYRQA